MEDPVSGFRFYRIHGRRRSWGGALVLALAGALAATCFVADQALADSTIYILELNDTHDRTQNHHYAREADLIASLRQQYGAENCLVVHAGDTVSKGEMFAAKTRGHGNIAYWNYVGVDVWTLGNGDLYGRGDSHYYDIFPSGVNNAKSLVSEFDGTVLSANFRDQADHAKPAIAGTQAQCVKRLTTSSGKTVKVGFFGLTYLHDSQVAAQTKHLGRNYNHYATDAINQLINQDKVDVVIPLTHLGFEERATRDGKTYRKPVEEKLIQDLQGFPALLGAHDHIPQKGTKVYRSEDVKQYYKGSQAKYNFSYGLYGNTGYAFGDGETDGSPVGHPVGVLKLVLDDQNRVKSSQYFFKELPAYNPNDPEQQACEQFLHAWIDQHKDEYAVSGYGPLTYADLIAPWPHAWLQSPSEIDPAAAVLAAPAPLEIRGETRTISDSQWSEEDQDVLIGDSGRVVVLGPDGAWDLSGSLLVVGDQGNGSLEIGRQAYVASDHAAIGGTETTTDPTAATGYVVVDGGTWEVLDWLDVGSYAQGRMDVRDGGTVYSAVSFIAYGPGSLGIASVEGDSYWDSGDMHLGYRGTGILQILNGATVVSGNVFLAESDDAQAHATLVGPGSRWYVGDSIYDDEDPVDFIAGQHGPTQILLASGGQMFIDGGMTLGPANRLWFGIDEDTPYRSILISGDAHLDGQLSATVVRPTRTEYVLLEANSITGNFSTMSVDEDLPLVDYTLVLDPASGTVRLTGLRTPGQRIVQYAATRNGRQVAAALDRKLDEAFAADPTTSVPFGSVLSRVLSQDDPAALGAAVESLVPRAAALPARVAVDNTFWFGQHTLAQLRNRSRVRSPDLLPSGPAAMGPGLEDLMTSAEQDADTLQHAARTPRSAPAEADPTGLRTASDPGTDSPLHRYQNGPGQDGLWGTVYGAYGDQDATAGRTGFHYWSTGFLVGAEAERTDDQAAGIALAYNSSEFAATGNLGRGETDSLRFGPYFAWQDCGRFLDVVLSGGIHWNELERRTAFGSLNAAPTNSDLSLAAELGRELPCGALTLTPIASAIYTYLFQGDYQESNADAGALWLEGGDLRSLRTVLGVRFDYALQRSFLEFQVGWMHEYLDDGQHFVGSLLSSPASMDLWFPGADRDAFYGAAGLATVLEDGSILSAKYYGLVSGNNQDHAGLLSLTVGF